jgi:enolase-phosphatase E1
VTVRLAERGIRAVLLDIEGTTTPIAFVHEVLFAFARARLREYLDAHRESGDVIDVRNRLAVEHAADVARGESPPPWSVATDDVAVRSIAAYASWLMDRDRKSPGLKLLQGLIWEEGYRACALRGEVYDDVPGAIRRWRDAGLAVAIYSSGSVLAQRRLFESTPHGDLMPLVDRLFDTAVGAKIESASYARIAAALGHAPADILFVSDVAAELIAARRSGMAVVLCVREGNQPQPRAGEFEAVRSFDEIG